MGEYEGEVKLNLNGPNADKIKISVTKVEKNGLSKRKETSGVELITMFVRKVFINNEEYAVVAIVNKEDETLNNYCLKKFAGTDSLGLYTYTDDGGLDHYYARTSINNEVTDIENSNYYASNRSAISRAAFFRKCPTLADKIRNKTEGYMVTDSSSLDDKLSFWKKSISEYYNCKPQ